MKFDRKVFVEGYKAGFKKALKETAITMNYSGNTADANSTIGTESRYSNDQFVSLIKKKPVDPNAITLEDKKVIYKEIRYGLLAALMKYFGEEVHQNWLKEYFDPRFTWRSAANNLVEELRLALRKNKDVKHHYKSKIDIKEVLDLCKQTYNTGVKFAVQYANQHPDKIKIDNAAAKIYKCANKLREKVCKSVATSLSKRLGLDTMERAANGSYAWKYLQRVAELGPEKAGKPVYPYSEDY